MLTTEREKRVCNKYSQRDENGLVRCHACPLVKDLRYLMCKANSHYDRHTHEWEPDEMGVQE